ncbi:MAG TPA: dihydroxyacetone kinase subunit DhaL [Candidatus Limnocylindria bacterium]
MTPFVRRWLQAAAERIIAQASELTELDARIGDGDHGINLARGMSLVRGALVDAPAAEPAGELLRRSGRLLISSVGGASGPLYGTLFLETGQAVGDADRLAVLGPALVHGVGGVGRRGRSTVGQKTMLDTLVPAARALAAGGELSAAVERAIHAARIGCESTRDMVAQRGRASYLGERAIGHLDPGAVSSRLLIEALATAVASGQPPALTSIPPRR